MTVRMDRPARSDRDTAEPDERRSWFDGLIDWIDRLPGPSWVFYGGALLIVALANNARLWLEGALPFGDVDPSRTVAAVYSVYFVALTHYLDDIAGRAFDTFRPLLAEGVETERLRRRLMVLPWRAGATALLAGVVLGPMAVGFDPEAFGLDNDSPVWAWAFTIALTAFNIATLVAFGMHAFRRLMGVHRIHALAQTVDAIDPRPVYAFSTLTARTGMGLVIFSLFLFVQDPTPGVNPVAVLGLISLMGLGVASFLWPLSGMHERLVAEIDDRMSQVAVRLDVTAERLHRAIDEGDLESVGDIKQAFDALRAERELLESLPRWPWRPETLRLFVTTLLMPVALWLSTEVLERLLEP